MTRRVHRTRTIIESFVLEPLDEGHGTRTAFIAPPPEGPMTYDDLAAGVARVSLALTGQGIAPGDRVLLALPDSPQLVLGFLGAIAAGAVAVPVNPALGTTALEELLVDSGATAAVGHGDSLAALRAIRAVRVPALRCVFDFGPPPRHGAAAGGPDTGRDGIGHPSTGVGHRSADVDHGPGDAVSLGTLAAAQSLNSGADAGRRREEWFRPARSDSVAFWLYTSGSTGVPKAAVHAHADAPYVATTYFGGRVGLEAGDLVYSTAKLFFAYGLGNTLLGPLGRRACALLVAERSSVEVLLGTLERFRPTVLCSVPTLFARLLSALQTGPLPGSDRLRRVTSAGEPLPGPIFTGCKERFGLEILDGIGSTEALHVFISNPPGQAIPGCMGSVVEGYQARVVDDSGAPVPTGATGRLMLRGGSLMSGYWNRPEADAAVFDGAWMWTGDLVTCDAKGQFFYQGRADEMFKVKGQWVVPLVVEAALLAHPAVAEAAVVSGVDASGLATVRAFLVARPGHVPGPELAKAIGAHAAPALPRHAVPTDLRFVAELPRTPTGKVQRFRLRGLEAASAAGRPPSDH